MGRESRFCLWVVLIGALTRALYCFWIVPSWEHSQNFGSSPDAYSVLAESLLTRGELGYLDYGASPTTLRGPGFPGWLVGGLVLGGKSIPWLAWWGSLPMVVVIAWGATWIRSFVGSLRASLFAGLALAHPLAGFAAGRCMADDFYAALGFATLLVWHRAALIDASRRRLVWLIVAALLGAILVLTRSTGVLFVMPMIWASLRRKLPLMQIVLLAALMMLPATLWSVRSSRLEGRPVFVSSLLSYNFWFGRGFDRARAMPDRTARSRQALELVLTTAGRDPAQTPHFWYIQLAPGEVAQLEQRLQSAAWTYIKQHPGEYLGSVARGTVRFWFGAETAARERQYLLASGPFVVLAVLGFWRGRRLSLVRTIGVIIVLHMLVYAATLPMARMSVQIYPLVALLALLGADYFLNKESNKLFELRAD